MSRVSRHAKRLVVGIVGSLVVMIGIIAIPYPGPGWLIVFAGLSVLATEFVWAQRLLDKLREHYDSWVLWLKRQRISIKLFVSFLTFIVVVVTVWLVNGYGFMNDWIDLRWDWARSPFVTSPTRPSL
jgi:uncharacterized protein (TIGR02611 family)